MCSTSLKDMFDNSFARWGEKPAITFLRYGDVETALTYGQLDRDANRLAHMFQQSGFIYCGDPAYHDHAGFWQIRDAFF